MAEELCVLKRAPDAGDSVQISSSFNTLAESCSQTETTPAPAQVTHAVGLTFNNLSKQKVTHD